MSSGDSHNGRGRNRDGRRASSGRTGERVFNFLRCEWVFAALALVMSVITTGFGLGRYGKAKVVEALSRMSGWWREIRVMRRLRVGPNVEAVRTDNSRGIGQAVE